MAIIMHQGDTYPDAVWQLFDDDTNPISIPSGSTFTLYLYDPRTNTVRAGTGSWEVNSYTQARATYSWSSHDTATDGTFRIYARITTPLGQISSTDEITLNIIPALIVGGIVLTSQDINIIQVNGTAISAGNPVPTSITSLPAGTNVIGHVIVDSAGSVSVTSLPSLPAGSSIIGSVKLTDSGGTNQIQINSAGQAQVEDIEQSGYIALTSPPANTNAGSDTVLTFSSQVSRVIVQNNTSATFYLDFDQVASTASFAILPGTLLVYPKKCTSPHLYTTVATPLNAASGILLRGAL